jgi:transcriptional regulator with XRE-family HTH domain
MKKDTNLKSVLGLTQEEIAMLLGISRVQWAHFTDGRRDIPSDVKVKLAEVLSTIQKNNTKPEEVNIIIETEKKKVHDWLEKELKIIELKELVLDKKIKKITQVREEAFRALEMAHYIESQKVVSSIDSLTKFIQIRAKNTLKKHSLLHLYELQLKKETLEMLKLKISKKLKL